MNTKIYDRKVYDEKYYYKNVSSLRKKRNEKYQNQKETNILKINGQYFASSLSKEKYKLSNNIKDARMFMSKNALNNIINKYQFKEEEVEIINV